MSFIYDGDRDICPDIKNIHRERLYKIHKYYDVQVHEVYNVS